MISNAALNGFDRADALGEKIAELAAELTAGVYRLIEAISAFDAIDGPMKQGALTTEQWLSWRIGMGKREASEKVRVARALRELPLTREAFRTARISFSKTRAIVRVATPENEGALVDIARSCPAAQLEIICRKFRAIVSSQKVMKTPEDAEAERYARHYWTDEGMLHVTIQLPADEGARLVAAIESGQAVFAGEGVVAGEDVVAGECSCCGPNTAVQPANEQRRANKADGLMTVVESYFAEGPKPRRGGAPNEVVVHVSAESLVDNAEGAYVDNVDGQAISAETARRLSCDAGIVRVVEGAKGEVLDVGRKTRSVPSAIRRAIEARDGRVCSFPGCSHAAYLDGHHIVHWADGGETNPDNVCLLCSRHHRWVHERGYVASRGEDGCVGFIDPNGERVEASPELAVADSWALRHRNAAEHLHTDADTLTPDWDGERVDEDQVMMALCCASSSSFG